MLFNYFHSFRTEGIVNRENTVHNIEFDSADRNIYIYIYAWPADYMKDMVNYAASFIFINI